MSLVRSGISLRPTKACRSIRVPTTCTLNYLNFLSVFLSGSNISRGERRLNDKRNLSTSGGQILTGPTTGITTGQVSTILQARKRQSRTDHRTLGAAELVSRADLANAKIIELWCCCLLNLLTPGRVADGAVPHEGTSLDATRPHSKEKNAEVLPCGVESSST